MSKLFLATMPKFTLLAILFKKPMLLIAALPIVAISPQVDFYSVVSLLFWLFVIDLITGLLASYFEWKKESRKGKNFFGSEGGYSSDKFKKCFIKGAVYAGFPIIVLRFQQVFMIKSFSVNYISEAQIDITIATLLLFCANEIFSIFWENLPKCGLNLPKAIKDFLLGVKEIK